MRLHKVMRTLAIPVLAVCGALINGGLGSAVAAEAKKGHAITSVDVEVAMGEVGDKELARGIYILHLKCAGSCELTRMTLNQCTKSEDGSRDASFVPRVDNWIGAKWISAEQTGTRIEITVYQAFERRMPAKMTWIFNPSDGALKSLSELKSAGFIDYSQFPAKVVPIAFEPIPRDRLKILNCPLFVEGLSR